MSDQSLVGELSARCAKKQSGASSVPRDKKPRRSSQSGENARVHRKHVALLKRLRGSRRDDADARARARERQTRRSALGDAARDEMSRACHPSPVPDRMSRKTLKRDVRWLFPSGRAVRRRASRRDATSTSRERAHRAPRSLVVRRVRTFLWALRYCVVHASFAGRRRRLNRRENRHTSVLRTILHHSASNGRSRGNERAAEWRRPGLCAMRGNTRNAEKRERRAARRRFRTGISRTQQKTTKNDDASSVQKDD